MDKNTIYQAFVGYLNSKNYTREDFEAELVNNTVTPRSFILNLEAWYRNNVTFETIIDDIHNMFSFDLAIKNEGYWSNLWSRGRKVQETLSPFFPKPLTNEDILVLFLKKHRAFSAYKRGLATTESTNACRAANAILHAFHWDEVKEMYFNELDDKWKTLCKELKLIGELTPKSLQNRRT